VCDIEWNGANKKKYGDAEAHEKKKKKKKKKQKGRSSMARWKHVHEQHAKEAGCNECEAQDKPKYGGHGVALSMKECEKFLFGHKRKHND